MKLSVIIVNYNVQYFLEQCLISVEAALKGMDAEVWVVDNASVDGSVAMVEEKFPWVKLVANVENVGFSRANNQAIRGSLAEYVLLLNPDTVVQEDTFQRTVEYMDKHPQTGGLGIRMVDGKGRFLPESKRGLPRPWPAFCKISGLYRLFPRSRRFNSYYMGHLDAQQTNPVEILSGAFMLMRKTALDKVGLLDETFFMYGEDIDLSWRLILGGYSNVYFADSSIIHYKGESTKKGSLNYVFVFYNAMIIFARKHFSSKHARAFTGVINAAIYARAALAIMQRFIRRMWLPVLDAVALFVGMWAIKWAYSNATGIAYRDELVVPAFAAYTLVWIGFGWFSGIYDRSARGLSVLGGWLVAALLVTAGYSLLPEEWRFSRALTLLAALWALGYVFLSRSLIHGLHPGRFRWPGATRRNFALVGGSQETDRVLALMRQTRLGGEHPVRVFPGETVPEGYIGSSRQLAEIIRVHKLDEVIFCAADMTSQEIISTMGQLSTERVEFRIAPPESLYIIGSNSINTSGDLFIVDVHSVNRVENRRRKRVLDVMSAALLVLTSPVLMWAMQKPAGLPVNALRVLVGLRTWVGYAPGGKGSVQLPKLKAGIIHPMSHMPHLPAVAETVDKLNTVYARDYRLLNDIKLLLRSFRKLGGA